MRTDHVLAFGLAGLVAGVAGATPDSQSDYDKYLAEVAAKGDSPDARRAAVDAVYHDTRGPAPDRDVRVIYGADDRLEVYEYDTLDPTLRAMAEACAIVVDDSDVFDNGDGTYTLTTNPWTSAGGGTLCTDEPFRGQLQLGFCSSFLVGQDLITTAGHCVDAGDISAGVAFVFGFQLNDSDETGPTIVPADWVYFGTGIVDQALGGGDDHSVVQLDRPVVGINPVPIRRTGVVPVGTPLAVVGHPAGIIKKIAGGAEVKANQSGFFQSNLDTYGGNSGSMVINLNTYQVEGILVRGAPDYTSSGGCIVSNEVPDTGNTGGGLTFEECSVTTTFEGFIPPLGIVTSPGGTVVHYGVVGGPFSEPTTVYTMTNTTTEPADYSVVLSDPGAGVLIDGGTSTLTGTLAPSTSVDVTVTLDNAVVNALPAGVTSSDVIFADETNTLDLTVTHVIEVGQTLVSVDPVSSFGGGGPVGGPFPGMATYTITSERPTPVDVMIDGPDWVQFSTTTRTDTTVSLTGEGDFTDLTVTYGGTASSLAAGLYTDTITITNLDNLDEITIPVALDVGRYVFPSGDTPIAITDNATFTSTITVGEGFCVADVDVDLDLTHTFSGDLIITLTSPVGTSVVLQNEDGGSADFGPTFYDDDDAGNTPASGPGALADFENEIATGVWTLTVEDDAGGDQGTLNSWDLRLAALEAGCVPNSVDGSFTVSENGLATASLVANSAGDPITSYTIESLPASGVLWDPAGDSILTTPYVMTGNQVEYRATPGNVGGDEFEFSATSAAGASNTATMTVDILAINPPAPVLEFPLDTDPGWSTDGQWAWGVPTGGGGAGSASGPDPTSGFTGANVYGYNLNGDYANNLSAQYLTTPDFDVSGVGISAVGFQRWLGMENSIYDEASFDVRVDGGSWTEVWTHDGGSFGDDAWIYHEYDISAMTAGASTLGLRWRLGSTDGSVVYPGWNLDDIAIIGVGTFGNPADLNLDGSLTPDDIADFVAAFVAMDPIADMNGDGSHTPDDIAIFVSSFTGG